MITYEPFWDLLKQRGISQYHLIHFDNLSPSLIHKLLHNESITLYTLNRLCNLLDCTPEDIIRFTPDEA